MGFILFLHFLLFVNTIHLFILKQPLSSRNSNALRSLSSSSQSLSGAAGSKKKDVEAEKTEREKEKKEREEKESPSKGSLMQHSSLYSELYGSVKYYPKCNHNH